ncbi:hypothetical protein [Sphingomonas turrisvirgatae]|nr:hypothetical protein [Sphingomonas turrisvirgatae]
MIVSDAEIDALVAKGWNWHAAYRHLQTIAHAKATSSGNVTAEDRERM